MKRLSLLSLALLAPILAPEVAQAAPPLITDGPRTWSASKYSIGVKFTISQPTGFSSTTLQNTLGVASLGQNDSVTLPAGQGMNYPIGAIMNIGFEHMMVIDTPSADVRTVVRGYSANGLGVVSGNLLNITVTGTNTCVANYSIAHFYPVGAGITVSNAPGAVFGGSPWTISSATTNSVTWTCTGSTNGVYTNLTLATFMNPLAHTIGAAVTRVDSDAWVQWGPTAAYGTCTAFPPAGTNFQQDMNHWGYIPPNAPGSTIHWRVLSTPKAAGTTNCTSPGANTVFSSDNAVTLGTTPVTSDPIAAADPRWNTSDSLVYSNDLPATANCADIQSKIHTIAGADGNNNQRVTIPASANLLCNLVTEAKYGAHPGGPGKLVLSTADYASLPAAGNQVDPSNAAVWLNHMPKLYTASSAPVIQASAGQSYWIIRGIQMTVDPTRNTANSAWLCGVSPCDTFLVNTFTGSYTDDDKNYDPNHLALVQNYIYCTTYQVHCAGMRWHGDYLSAIDNYIGPVYGISNDRAGIQTDGYDSQYIYVYHNYIEATFSGYYNSDNGLNPSDGWVMRNTIVKRRIWNFRDAEFAFSATQAVSGMTLGTSTTVTTLYENDFQNGHPLLFSGGTGSYATMNYKSWSVAGAYTDTGVLTTGTLGLTCSSGTCSFITSAPHGLQNGDLAIIGGGHSGNCQGFSTGSGVPVTVTVADATHGSFTLGGSDWSTQGGTNLCVGSNPTMLAPAYTATFVNASQSTIPLNSTGFTGTRPSTVWYPQPNGLNIKNAFEFKTGVRWRIEGNIITGSWSANQSGQLMSLTVRGPDSFYGWQPAQGPNNFLSNLTISDVLVTNNIFRDGCTALAIIGANPNSPTTPMLRVSEVNNVWLNVSGTATGGGTCTQSVFQPSQSYEVTQNHSTYQTLGRVAIEDGGKSPLYINTNNIYNASNVEYNLTNIGAGLINGYTSPGGSATGYSWLSSTFARNVRYGCKWCAGSSDPWGFTQQYWYGLQSGSQPLFQGMYYPPSQQDVGFAGNMVISAATGTAPVTLTVPSNPCQPGDYVMVDGMTGKTQTNGLWPVQVGSDSTHIVLGASVDSGFYTGGGSVQPWGGSCATLASVGLSPTSNYLAGVTYVAPSYPPSTAGAGPGNDTLTVGANINQIQAAINGTGVSSTVMQNVIFRNLVIH